MKDNYNKKIAPFTYDSLTQRNTPARVNVSLSILDVTNIREVDHVYSLKFRLTLEWFDYRIKYNNLKIERSSNTLSMEEVDRLWVPHLVFANTAANDGVEGTKKSEVTLTREDDYIRSGVDQADEVNIFNGRFNRITFAEVYTKEFKCEYKLDLYPFDTQVT